MAYGIIKVDTITFTDGGIDKSVSISGLVQNPTITGNLTVTGTVSGTTIQGGTLVSGLTVVGTSGTFTSLTGTTTQGTTASFTTGTFTSLTGATTAGTTATFTSGSFTTLTGTTTSGTTANFVSGVFSTRVSGATITGNAGAFTTLTGGTATITSGVFASGTAAAPSVSVGTTDNGLYSPGTDQVAISTNGTGRLFVASDGKIGVGNASPQDSFSVTGGGFSFADTGGAARNISWKDFSNNIAPVIIRGEATSGALIFFTNTLGNSGSERLRITSDGKLGLGTSSPSTPLHVVSASPTDGIVAQFNNSTNTAGTDCGLRFQHSNTSQLQCDLLTTRSGSNAGLDFKINLSDSAGTPQTRFTILEGGNVGIGTTSPTSTLHLGGSPTLSLRDGKNWVRTSSGNPVEFGSFNGYTFNKCQTSDYTIDTEFARIDSSGRLLVGTSSALAIGESTPAFQLVGAGAAAWAGILRTGATAAGSNLVLAQTRGSASFRTIAQSGDVLGTINFAGDDGVDVVTTAATISAAVDGTPGANDMPGRLVFSVTADGASSPTEAMRIKNTRVINFSNAPVYADNAAAKTGGLVDGDVYRTSTGDLKIVYT